MTSLSQLPYHEVVFNADGTSNTTTDQDHPGLTEALAAGGVKDVFVFSHGWNNGVASARDLYLKVFSLLAGQLGEHLDGSVFVGVLWPSLLFPGDDSAADQDTPPTPAQVVAAISPAFAPAKQKDLAAISGLLTAQEQDPKQLTEFHTLAVGLVTTPPQGSEDAGESTLLNADTMTALGHAASMATAEKSDAQGAGDLFSGLWSGARELLRTLSYYEMKNRAGVIGRQGLGPLLGRLDGPDGPPRIHLIGHSFGARLVSYALSGLPDTARGAASPVKSLTLIQGAFSHFAFAATLPFDRSRPGALSEFVDRVDGPLLSTFSSADRAVGWWYPAASMLARQDAESADDVTFRWGGMGHDGYQNDPPAHTVTMGAEHTAYDFQPGTFYALDANAVIDDVHDSAFSGAHSDIKKPAVTWAIREAARL